MLYMHIETHPHKSHKSQTHVYEGIQGATVKLLFIKLIEIIYLNFKKR